MLHIDDVTLPFEDSNDSNMIIIAILGQMLNSNLPVCEVGKTSLQIFLLYMTPFSTIFN